MLADREEPVMTASTDPDRPAAERSWPYPSYADRSWLGGDRGPDRALATVVRGLRGLVAETGGRASGEPEDLLAALEQLASIGERVSWAMLSLVGEARSQGVPWAGVGGALGVTKQAAQQRFGPYVAEALSRAAGTAD
jgi:hypothetical protein